MRSNHPTTTDPYRPPARLLLREVYGTGLVLSKTVGRRIPRTGAGFRDAPAALVIPGGGAPDWTMAPMHRALRAEGYRTFASQRGLRNSCVQTQTDRLERRLENCVAESGRRMVVVGVSLGGLQAKLLGVRRPDLVAGVITMGSPIHGVHDLSVGVMGAAKAVKPLSGKGLPTAPTWDCLFGDCWERTAAALQSPLAPDIRYTTIYGRLDWVVPPRAAVHPDAEQIEVTSSHCELPANAEICRIVASKLAEMTASGETAA